MDQTIDIKRNEESDDNIYNTGDSSPGMAEEGRSGRTQSSPSAQSYGRRSSYSGKASLMPYSMSELEEPYSMKKLPFELKDPLVYAIFAMGVSVVMTWGLCIMAVDDLSRQIPDASFAEFESAAAYKASSFFIAIAFFIVGHRLRFRGRVVATLLIQTLCVAGALHFAVFHEPMSYWVCLFIIAGAAHAMTQGGLSELCATAPNRYFRALCVGLAFGPVFIGGLKLLTKSMMPNPDECEKVWLLQIIVLYCCAAIVYIKYIDTDDTLRVTAAFGRGLPGESDSLIPESSRASSALRDDTSPWIGRCTRKVFGKTKFWLITLLGNLIISFIIFPGLASATQSHSKTFEKSGWFHESLFVIFLISDLVGRFTTGLPILQNIQPKYLLIGSIIRGLMIPAFVLLMHFDGPNQANVDVFTYVFIVVVGVTSGILVTACCVDPLCQVGIEEREVLGGFVFTFYISGQAIGVLTALGIKHLDRGLTSVGFF